MVTHRGREYHSWKTVGSDFGKERVNTYQWRPAEEWFDLEKDPWCLNNLAGPGMDGVFPAKLDEWMKQQGDEGDATERDAENRQPDYKPWGRKGGY